MRHGSLALAFDSFSLGEHAIDLRDALLDLCNTSQRQQRAQQSRWKHLAGMLNPPVDQFFNLGASILRLALRTTMSKTKQKGGVKTRHLGGLRSQTSVHGSNVRELLKICRMGRSNLLVDFNEQILPFDVLAQQEISMHHRRILIVLALQWQTSRHSQLQQKTTYESAAELYP